MLGGSLFKIQDFMCSEPHARVIHIGRGIEPRHLCLIVAASASQRTSKLRARLIVGGCESLLDYRQRSGQVKIELGRLGT